MCTFLREELRPDTFQEVILTQPLGVLGRTRGSGMVVLVCELARIGTFGADFCFFSVGGVAFLVVAAGVFFCFLAAPAA